MGCEDTEINHNRTFAVKGDCTERGEPPIVNYKTLMMTSIKVKVRPLMEVVTYYANDTAPTIMPINDKEEEREVSRSVVIPIKWAGEIVDTHLTPGFFLAFIINKTVDWSHSEGRKLNFVVEWASAACIARNKTTATRVSQLAIALNDVDNINTPFVEWAKSRLKQTLGQRDMGRI